MTPSVPGARIQYRNRRSLKRRHRRGATMLIFAVTIFALLALLALVLDYGLLVATRRQMQAVVNTAAVEGLRHLTATSDAQAVAAKVNMLASQVVPNGITIPTITGQAQNRVVALQPVSLTFQPNVGNNQAGDLVSGVYNPSALHSEVADYSRTDFSTSSNTADNSALLARLRLSDEANATGPSVAALFGLNAEGTLTNRLRATAIADSKPAKRVGVAQNNRLGVYAEAVDLNTWNTSNDFSGTQPIDASKVWSVGEELAGNARNSTPAPSGYIAIYKSINTVNRIVGFGFVSWQKNVYSKQSRQIAPENASAVWTHLDSIAMADLTEILNAHNQLTKPLLAPALVRSTQ